MVRGATAEQIKKAETGEYLTIDPAFCGIKQATRILAESNFDKASALIAQVSGLLDEGETPENIRVVCASPEACRVFRNKLQSELGSKYNKALECIEVITSRALALDILSTPEAQDVIGRSFSGGKARVLSEYEMDFVLEDLKTLGTRPRRLREIIKFFFRGLSELADEGEGWLITVEEKETLEFLQSELRFLQGVIEPELSNLASKAMRANDEIKKHFRKTHLLVSDYQNLSRASQLLCHLLAEKTICIAASKESGTEVFDSYPYREGIEEFVRINKEAQTIHLSQKQGKHSPHVAEWTRPIDEFEGVADLVEQKIKNGTSPDQIVIVCFHPLWFNQVASVLKKRAIPAQGIYRPLVLKGDVRSLEKSLPLRMVTALRLLADENDSLSWRSWFGFGDYLANSAAFVRERKKTQTLDSQAVFSDYAKDWEGWQKTQDFLKHGRDKTGEELLEYLRHSLAVNDNEKIPAVFKSLLELGETATAAEMVEVLDREQFHPQHSSLGLVDESESVKVTVSSLEMLASLSFDEVIVVGFVNGFFPVRRYFDLTEITVNQQKKMTFENDRRMHLLSSLSSNKMTLSYFKQVDLESAERLQLKPDRVVLQGEDRVSQVSLSVHAETLFA